MLAACLALVFISTPYHLVIAVEAAVAAHDDNVTQLTEGALEYYHTTFALPSASLPSVLLTEAPPPRPFLPCADTPRERARAASRPTTFHARRGRAFTLATNPLSECSTMVRTFAASKVARSTLAAGPPPTALRGPYSN